MSLPTTKRWEARLSGGVSKKLIGAYLAIENSVSEGSAVRSGAIGNRGCPRPGVGIFKKGDIEFADDETLGSALERRG